MSERVEDGGRVAKFESGGVGCHVRVSNRKQRGSKDERRDAYSRVDRCCDLGTLGHARWVPRNRKSRALVTSHADYRSSSFDAHQLRAYMRKVSNLLEDQVSRL